MYIGKHRGDGRDPSDGNVRIPENYVGNAFSVAEEHVAEECEAIPARPPEKEEHTEESACLPACVSSGCEGTKQGLRLDKLFSADALLILLAILFSGMDDGGDIAAILLLLLLF